MKAGATTLEEAPDRRVRTERSEQLDERAPDRKEHLFHPLWIDAFAMGGLDTERAPVVLDRRVEVLHGDADVIDLREHDQRFLGAIGGWSRAISSFAAVT